jgi:hypothetical protein
LLIAVHAPLTNSAWFADLHRFHFVSKPCTALADSDTWELNTHGCDILCSLLPHVLPATPTSSAANKETSTTARLATTASFFHRSLSTWSKKPTIKTDCGGHGLQRKNRSLAPRPTRFFDRPRSRLRLRTPGPWRSEFPDLVIAVEYSRKGEVVTPVAQRLSTALTCHPHTNCQSALEVVEESHRWKKARRVQGYD